MSDSAPAIDIDETSFESAVVARSHELPVLVDFWAAWCAPCRALAPVLDRVVESYGGRVALAKVNTDEQPRLAATFAVRSLPTVKLFRDGAVVGEFMGAQPESMIRALLEPHVKRDSDRLREQAATAKGSGDLAGAAALLTRALAEDPDNARIHPELAEVSLDLGDLEAAAAVLTSVPLRGADEERVTALRARLRLAQQSADSEEDEAALRAAVDADPTDCAKRLRLGAYLAGQGEHEAALEEFLSVLRIDRGFDDGAARKSMVDIFRMLGNSHPLVGRYRAMMASILN